MKRRPLASLLQNFFDGPSIRIGSRPVATIVGTALLVLRGDDTVYEEDCHAALVRQLLSERLLVICRLNSGKLYNRELDEHALARCADAC